MTTRTQLEMAYGQASSIWCRKQIEMIQAYDDERKPEDQERSRVAYVAAYQAWVIANKALKAWASSPQNETESTLRHHISQEERPC